MTFEEALRIKRTWPNPYEKDGKLYIPYVVPSNGNDYAAFTTDLKKEVELKDQDAKKYCSDDDFMAVGLSIEGNNITWENL